MGVKISAGPDDGPNPNLDLNDPGDDLDDDLDDEPDDDLDDDESDDDPDGGDDRDVTIADLRSQLEKLSAASKRNNRELAASRRLRNWMKANNIGDVDDLTARLAAPAQQSGVIVSTTEPAPAEPAPAEPASAPADTATGNAAPQALPAPPTPVAPTPAPDQYRQKLEREQERNEVLITALRQTAIEAELARAGFSGSLDRAMRVVAFENVTVDDDGNATGHTDEVASLKREFPEWFQRRRDTPPPPAPPRRGGERADGGDKRPVPPARTRSWEQTVADQMRRPGR